MSTGNTCSLDSSSSPVPFIDLTAQYRPLRDEIMEAVESLFSRQQFVLGDEVAELECDIAEYCDTREAIGCNSGTDALVLAMMAAGIGPGDEVITSPFTFFATAGAICRVGATPVFADIQREGFNIDPQAVEDAVTPRTRAIVPVHLYGQCADMEPLWRLAVQHDLTIIEDAAQAIGAEYRGRRAGVLGSIGCFSFFPTKNLGGAGDGGMLTTDDAETGKRLRRLRVHGDAGGYEHLEVGINSRLDSLQAAVVRIKLRRLEDWTAARQQNAARYQYLIEQAGLQDDVEIPAVLSERRHVYNQYCIRLKDGLRDAVLANMRARQLGCAVYYPKPLHLQTCFADLGYRAGQMPQAEAACRQVLALPIYPELPADHQDRIVAGLKDAIAEARRSGQTSKAA